MKSSSVHPVTKKGSTWAIAGLFACLLALAFASLAMGRYPLTLDAIVAALTDFSARKSSSSVSTAETIVLMIRLPRIIAAMAIGGGLALAGSHYQTIFRNPMASPSLLGVSAGAGFAASVAILLRQSPIIVEIAGFIGGMVTVLAVFLANRAIGGRSTVTLVLCGLAMSALFQALISVAKYVADPVEVLPSITFWLMGSLAKIDAGEATIVSVAVLSCAVVLYLSRWRISILALGDDEAASLGVNVARHQALVIVCATLMSAATVCVAGIVGWVGLLIPHIARMIVGLEPGRLFFTTALLGAIFVLGVDDLARTISIIEVPLGVLTAIIGAPFFFFLLLRSRQRQWA